MLKDLLKFVGYGFAAAIFLPPILTIFAITAMWSLFAFLALLAIW